MATELFETAAKQRRLAPDVPPVPPIEPYAGSAWLTLEESIAIRVLLAGLAIAIVSGLFYYIS